MSELLPIVVSLLMLLSGVFTEEIIGKPCTIQSSNSSGTCEPITTCQTVIDDLIHNKKLPQACGIQEAQPIVCCPKFRRPGDVRISVKKCKEYASRIEHKNQCDHRIVKRIVGSVPAGRTEFPHMVVVGFKSAHVFIGTTIWFCGGSIISEQYVLTAAHCLSLPMLGDAKMVLLGITNLNDTSHRQEIKIVERVAHPEYDGQTYHDIALLKLERPIKFNSYMHPACLHTTHEINTTTAVAIGWVITTGFGTKWTNELLKMTLDIVDHQFCNQNYGHTHNLNRGIRNDTQICTGRGTVEKDNCRRYGGVPLQIRHNGDDASCMYDIIGITSFGKNCSDGPSVSTRVSHYVKWIEDIVWPEKTE